MKDISKIIFIIQARTQSTRISRKMVREFSDGDSLMDIAIKKLKCSDIIPPENIWLSVMDDELIEIAKKYNIDYYVRSEESTQEPIKLSKVFEWYKYFMEVGFEWYVNINACNPIITLETIEDFVDGFIHLDEVNGLFAVKKVKNFTYNEHGILVNKFEGDKDYLVTLETKLVSPVYMGAHVLYAGKLEDIGKNIYMGTFKKGGGPAFYHMNPYECFDIDNPGDWVVAKTLYESGFNPSKFLV